MLLDAMKSFVESASSAESVAGKEFLSDTGAQVPPPLAATLLAASPLMVCKESLLGGIQAALEQTENEACVVSAVLLASSVLSVCDLLTHSEVTWWASFVAMHGSLGYRW